ncbi:PREDICTED: universal stress protein A-like protein isoform X1 [Fragaria vesca subsp. vesca]|uniref:universal stress protein A-like protein isoform X1 n=1 Tax=Fragaria vesca subsp. vesca TaxID=101020 RepID=UPI0002C31C49|nr:PREDICTED: universal stress protein A-like protein isoform X1 [Fragaria vesca subsp. vesca]
MADVAEKERRILVAVDEGEESMYALSWCLGNVVSSKDTLILVYVKPPKAVYMPLDGTGRSQSSSGYMFSSDLYATMENYSNEVANSVIEKAKNKCRDVLQEQDVKVETRIENGDPRDVICHLVEQLGAHILVMGSRGYGLIKRAFLGSVSNHCAQNVNCPVLIVKKPKTNNGSK